MSSLLHFHGFYATGPSEWEEWHAGVRMHGIRYHYTRYYRNGDWIHCYRDHEFDFWAFTETVTPELMARAKQGRSKLHSFRRFNAVGNKLPTLGSFLPTCRRLSPLALFLDME